VTERGPQEESEEVERPPITFWIMIGLAVLYLGWRLVQGIIWLIDRIV
jgi:hypothetical protein